IMKWVANGTEANGSTILKIDTIYKEKFVQYYADYLNFMHTKNLKIDYLDITNEKNDITPEILIYAAQTLPTLLNPGVHMPQIIAPSSWSYEAGVEYLDKIPSNGLNAFQIAASHNTGDPGTVESFVAKANQLNKTPWNSELHKWVGINTKDQVLNTEHFLNAMNGGIVGVCSWLFYGPLAGKDHTMIWSNSTSSKKSVKYEIFKKVVNNTNGGNLYETTSEQGIIASTFVKDSITVVTVLNKSNSKKINTKLNFGAKDISTSKIEITQWQSGLATEGTTTQFTPTEKNNLTYTLDSNSVYTFKITTPKAAPLDTIVVSPLGLPTSLEKNSFANTFKIFPNPAIDFIKIEATKFELKNATFIILNNIGKKVKSGKLDAENINISDLAKGIYFIKITNKAQSETQKFIKK
ncbi:MAG: T9SS type A sorting domain-containing protein, partial [Pseudarcicella sp.]|nr:T9SS type A sorting domain-containing protein [Pseudarcicella sp.]